MYFRKRIARHANMSGQRMIGVESRSIASKLTRITGVGDDALPCKLPINLPKYQQTLFPVYKDRTFVNRRDKILQKMRNSPNGVRFADIVSLLYIEGFVLFNRRGSHCTFHRADGRLLTIVRPHGSRNTCHPADIRKLLEAIER